MNLKKIVGKKKKDISNNKKILNKNINEDETKTLKLLYDDLVDNDKVIAQRGELVYLTDGLWITPEGEVIDLGR